MNVMRYKSLILCGMLILGMGASLEAQNLGRVQRGQRGYTPPPLQTGDKKMYIEDELADIDTKMDIYQAELQLDEFEKAVMKNMIIDYETQRKAMLQDETIEYQKKMEQVEKYKEALRKELEVFLTEEEIRTFSNLHFNDDKLDKIVKKKKKENKRNRKN